MKLTPSLLPKQIDKSKGFESWYYEEKNGISIYSVRYPNREVGRIGKRKLLTAISRIYGIDFSKMLRDKK